MKRIVYYILLTIFFCNIHSLNYASYFHVIEPAFLVGSSPEGEHSSRSMAPWRRQSIKEKYKLTAEESYELDSFLFKLNGNDSENSYIDELALLIKIKPKNNRLNFSSYDRIDLLREALKNNIHERNENFKLFRNEKINSDIFLQQSTLLKENGDEICKEIKEICGLKDC
ncbi:MAG: hypothetical protein JO129_00770 [Candidatus Dependentiae bacterium]|nr:hypothetical protein [Candidatus Dependentiae bacterium]